MVILEARPLRPGADCVASPDVDSFVVDDGVRGEAGGDTIGIVRIGRGEVVAQRLRQLQGHGASRRSAPAGRIESYYRNGKNRQKSRVLPWKMLIIFHLFARSVLRF